MVEVNTLKVLDRPEVLDLFFHTSSKKGSSEGGFEPLEVRAEDGILIHGRVFLGEPAEPHIVFFPGEFDNPETIQDLARGFGQMGFTLVVMDYRGTGESQGKPSVEWLFSDARAFLRDVCRWKEDAGRSGPLVPMGRSFGAGVALDAAFGVQEEILALILESAFDKTSDFFQGHGLKEAAEAVSQGPDPFANREKMKDFKPPVLFLHSHIDDIVNINQVEWLVAESRSKATQFQIVPSDGRQGLYRTGGQVYFSNIKDYLFLRMGRRPKYVPRRLRKKGS